jgi:hypothetical protein
MDSGGNKMKKHARKIIYVAAIAAAVAILALFLRDARQRALIFEYRADAPTAVKFSRLAQWIPEGTEFDVTIDIPRALTNPATRERLMNIAHKNSGVANELISALLNNEKSIGLITLSGRLGDKDLPPQVFALAQGDFNKDVILPAIRSAMANDKAGISAQNLEWSTLYYESDKREPFGFMLLDSWHMAVGEKKSLEAFFLTKPRAAEGIRRMSDDVIFGHIEIGNRVKSLLPNTLALPDSLDFSSTDGAMLTARMLCENQVKAMDARMFLEGVRSLMLLQHENNATLVSILEGITTTSDTSAVLISTKLAPLLDLWVSETEKGNIGEDDAKAI